MGKISRIQLRGISRSPSDRMTEDGGVAESLNAYIDEGELAPVSEPVLCHEDFGMPESTSVYEPVYIHKTNVYEHVIVYRSSVGDISYLVDGEPRNIIKISGLQKITHLGNTLIMTHRDGVSYAVFKNNEYIEISMNEDSLPKLSFVNICQPAGAKGSATHDIWYYDDFAGEYAVYADGDAGKNYLVADGKKLDLANKIWESYRSMVDNNLALGCLSHPVMLRYGLKLYDGSYIWVSSPIMLGSCLPKTSGAVPFGNFNDYHSPLIALSATSSKEMQTRTFVQLSSPYRIGVNVHRTENLAKLRDIISSIDVFVSDYIDFYPEGKNHVKGERVLDVQDDFYDVCHKYTLDPVNSEDPQKIEDAILAASNFFLIKSYSIDNLPEDTDVIKENLLGENLFVKTALKDSKTAIPIAGAAAISTYNGRLLVGGIDEYFSRGIGVLNGQCANPFDELIQNGNNEFTYGFAYHIPSADIVVKDYDAKDGEVEMAPDMGKALIEHTTVNDVLSTPYAWLSHPNPDCTRVTVRIFANGLPFNTYNIEMKPHPYLRCSYAFIGLGKRIFREGVAEEDDFDSYNDLPVIHKRNVAAMSNLDNPFVFSASSKQTLNDEVKGFAIATDPMSTGQFGQYPIYFFLDDGIWTTTISSEGGFGSSPVLVSREVCSNPDTITPTKKSIFFMSNRGLLMISGSEVISISEHMYGKPYTIPDHLINLIECAGFEGLVDDESVENFRSFMNSESTKIAYDYVGQRLICYNSNMKCQYVYCIKGQTWHRTTYGYLSGFLNAYPRCVVTTKNVKRVGSQIVATYGLLDISLSRSEDVKTKKILTVTRPFDLGESDVFKTIRDIRVRGQFPKCAVKFILLGSNDGINFVTVSTLRGRSWKLFRMIILADLDATDRISWIDIQYETRFTNKLR